MAQRRRIEQAQRDWDAMLPEDRPSKSEHARQCAIPRTTLAPYLNTDKDARPALISNRGRTSLVSSTVAQATIEVIVTAYSCRS